MWDDFCVEFLAFNIVCVEMCLLVGVVSSGDILFLCVEVCFNKGAVHVCQQLLIIWLLLVLSLFVLHLFTSALVG